MVIIIMNKRVSVAIRLTKGTVNLLDKFKDDYLNSMFEVSNSRIIEFSVAKLKEKGFDNINWLEMYNKESVEDILGKNFVSKDIDTRLSLKEETIKDIDYIKSIMDDLPFSRIYRSNVILAIMVAVFKTEAISKEDL